MGSLASDHPKSMWKKVPSSLTITFCPCRSPRPKRYDTTAQNADEIAYRAFMRWWWCVSGLGTRYKKLGTPPYFWLMSRRGIEFAMPSTRPTRAPTAWMRYFPLGKSLSPRARSKSLIFGSPATSLAITQTVLATCCSFCKSLRFASSRFTSSICSRRCPLTTSGTKTSFGPHLLSCCLPSTTVDPFMVPSKQGTQPKPPPSGMLPADPLTTELTKLCPRIRSSRTGGDKLPARSNSQRWAVLRCSV
mmetsp:Transcript_78093/g.208803  ORF Transcript_78093/g.208803 Transcript_78093/m.208803 type:complete len:247 (-) Transcript_78093:1162-1902(-)